tara:strand:+ start:1835 stop:2983 length:1149 start_codon:yes stop_codon:yes gene_type:complete
MNKIVNRWCKLAGILEEQTGPGKSGGKKDLHVFDFDDTLGVTSSPTLVAAVEYNGGDPNDPSSYIPIKNLKHRIGSVVKGLRTPTQADIHSPGLAGDTVSSNDELDNTDAIVLDTEQYRDWKEKYIPSGNHIRIVISPNIDSDIKAAGKNMFKRGITGEIHVADFSPSSTIGDNVKPISPMLDLLSKVASKGDTTAVVTSRKGKTDLDALGGGKIPATNASDISRFVAGETGVTPDIVIGAADHNPTDPASAKRDLITKLHNDQIDNVYFYDDDPENARKVAQICQGAEGMEGTELEIFNYEFSKGMRPTSPTFSCTISEDRKMRKLTESQIRRIIRRIIIESLDLEDQDQTTDEENHDESDFQELEEDDCPSFIKNMFGGG